MHTRSDNIEITIGDDNDDIIEELFKSFIQKYEEHFQIKLGDQTLNLMVLTFYYMILMK